MVLYYKRECYIVSSLPYVTSPGNIGRALNAIKAASVPERVSQDFVKTVLKIPGGSGKQITTYLKKLNLASSDGRPTEAYTKFRNPTTSGLTIAEAIKHAYGRLYVRNEYMHNLSDEELQGLIIEETGQPHDSNPVKLALACINELKKHAVFDKPVPDLPDAIGDFARGQADDFPQPDAVVIPKAGGNGIGLNLGYTINLNLPATSDPAVFNAIFKSLKQHLLREDDA